MSGTQPPSSPGAAARRHGPGLIASLPAGFFLALIIIEMALLVLLFVGWQWEWPGLGHDRLPAVLGGVFPIVVPWAAGLGGVLISLKGLVGHWNLSNSPDPAIRSRQRLRWNAWSLVRVPMGILLGTVGALLAVVFAGLVGTTDNGELDLSPLGMLTIALVAFVLGYRQDGFDALVGRVMDLLTLEADKAVRAEQSEIEGSQGSRGDQTLTLRANVGETRTYTATVTNPLDEEVDLAGSISLTGADKDLFTLVKPPGKAAAKAEFGVPISFHPTTEGRFDATLEVNLKDQTATVKLTGWGNQP